MYLDKIFNAKVFNANSIAEKLLRNYEFLNKGEVKREDFESCLKGWANNEQTVYTNEIFVDRCANIVL